MAISALNVHLSSYQFILVHQNYAWKPSESFHIFTFLSFCCQQMRLDGKVIISHQQMCHSSLRHPFYFRNELRCIICINHSYYHERETEKILQGIFLVSPFHNEKSLTKLCRTSCWNVTGHVVRTSSRPPLGMS